MAFPAFDSEGSMVKRAPTRVTPAAPTVKWLLALLLLAACPAKEPTPGEDKGEPGSADEADADVDADADADDSGGS